MKAERGQAGARKASSNLARRFGLVLSVLAWSLGALFFAASLLVFLADSPAPEGDSRESARNQPAWLDGTRPYVSSRPAPPEPSVTPSPTPSPEPGVAEDLLSLEEDLALAIEDYAIPGQYAIAATDLQTGETVSVNGDRPQLAGCVTNLFVLLEVARSLESGDLKLEDVDALVSATTWSSNASTARDLYTVVGDGDMMEGLQRVDHLIQEVLELEDVVFDHAPGYHEHSLGVDYNNYLTAEAANQALYALWNGGVVEGEWRTYLLGRLQQVKPGLNYLTAAVPEGVVSHKNGFFYGDTGYVDNDAGIVVLDRDGVEYAYAVSFFAQEVPSKYGDVPLAQDLMQRVYEVMFARHEGVVQEGKAQEADQPEQPESDSASPLLRSWPASRL